MRAIVSRLTLEFESLATRLRHAQFETTRESLGLVPLLGGCTAAYLVSCLLMKNTIMTEKLARRGARIPSEYAADFLESVLVRQGMHGDVITLDASDNVESVRAWLASKEEAAQHQGYPVMAGDELVGVLTRRDLLREDVAPSATMRELVRRPPVVAREGWSLREVADQMVRASVGRLPVVSDANPNRLVGIVTRSDLLTAHKVRLDAGVRQSSPSPLGKFRLARIKRKRVAGAA